MESQHTPFKELVYDRDWTVMDSQDKRYFRTYEDSEEQVRKDLQYHPDVIKDFINFLLADLASAAAVGYIGGLNDEEHNNETLAGTLTDLYDKIADLAEDLKLAQAGENVALLSNSVSFTSGDWKLSDGAYTLTLAQNLHGRTDNKFTYRIWANAGGVLREDVWAVAGTRVEYRPDRTIRLTADEPYDGRIVLSGVGYSANTSGADSEE